MIRRNAAQYTKNQESLKQHSFTAMRGVDATKAPTQPDTVLNTMNLDIDYDGGLILRKPLCVANALSNYIYVGYAFDKETRLLISENTINLNFSKFKLTDIFGTTHLLDNFDISKVLDFKNCKVVNTVTTVLISNAKCYLDVIEQLYNIKVYNSNVEDNEQPRVVKLFKEESSWILEILTPEVCVVTSDTIPVDFNTAMYYPMAIRDNYYSKVTAVKGILAYECPYTVNQGWLDYDGNIVSHLPTTAKIYKISTESFTTILDFKNFKISAKLKTSDTHNSLVFKQEGIPSQDIRSVAVTDWRGDVQIPIGVLDIKGFHLTDTNTSIGILLYPDELFPIVEGSVDICVSTVVQYIQTSYQYGVDFLTECKSPFKLIESVPPDTPGFHTDSKTVILKAFLDKPVFNYFGTKYSQISGYWSRSIDGVSWETITSLGYPMYNVVYKPVVTASELDDTKSFKWEEIPCRALNVEKYSEEISGKDVLSRVDCLIVSENDFDYSYKFTLIKSTDSTSYDVSELPQTSDVPTQYFEMELDSKTYWFKRTGLNYVENTFKNPNLGNLTYWKSALYSVSPDFKNNIYVSNPDSAIFPVSRIIDLGTFEGNTVTKLIPWRDYLVAFTENTVHLIKEQEVGFTTKVVNTFIGAPQRDADTCVATLNGIVFKSGSKLYSITPNVNSGDETIFNVSEISKPIEHILDKLSYNNEYKPFAFTTPEAYYLFVPNNIDTFCLKYNYTLRVWTQFKYPVLLYKYEMLSVSDIRVFGRTADGIVEYYFEKEPNDIGELQPYGDFLTTEKDSEQAYKISPIEFFVDSGQKTDNLSLTKQFVESKIIVATLSNKDNFEMDVQIAIEGNTFNKHIDINTDGALVRNASDQILTLGTTSNLTENEDTFNTMRQVFLRYSGRGKTIRHIIKGSSLYKFKIYETFYRFKILNVKQ